MENNNIFDNLTIDDIETLYPIDDLDTTTTIDENKEEKTMTRRTTVVTLEKINGTYQWKYKTLDSKRVSMASAKKDYTDKVEYSLEWLTNNNIPKFLKLASEDTNNEDFMKHLNDTVLKNIFNIGGKKTPEGEKKEGSEIPEAIIGDDGKVKVAVFASQGGIKSGERYYCDEEFVEAHKDEGAFVEYSADPRMKKYVELRRKISVIEFELYPMYLNAFADNSIYAEINNCNDEIASYIHGMNELNGKLDKSLIKDTFGIANCNQVTAFFWTPCEKRGTPMMVKIMEEIHTTVKCDGYVDTRNEKTWDIQDTMDGKEPSMTISIDDGSAFVDKKYAKAHDFFGKGIEDITQARSGIGYKNGVMTEIALDFKGTIQLVDMPEGMKDAIYVSSSTAKGLKRFSKDDIESCEYQFYTMDKNVHKDGVVAMGPQTLQYIANQATEEEMLDITSRQIDELVKLSTPEGYRDLVIKMTRAPFSTEAWKAMTSILEHKAFEGMASSRMFTFSAAKEATAMYNEVLGGTVTVEGASAKAQGDVNAILAIYKAQLEHKDRTIEEAATIPANTVVVPKEWKKHGLKKGQKVFIWRNPYNATIACVVTIHDFSELRDTIQMSALDNNGHKLASDNDGDTIYVSWNESIVNMAERTNRFAVKCGAKVLAYRTGEEDKSQRGIPAEEYLGFAPRNGEVGVVCEPLFGLVALIPWNCKDPDASIYCGKRIYMNDKGEEVEKDIYTTPREIYRLLDHGFVGTTYTIDSAKKHYVNAYSKTAQTERIKEIINGGTYCTKVYYHAAKVKVERNDNKKNVYFIGGNQLKLIGMDGAMNKLTAVVKKEICKRTSAKIGYIVDYRQILNGYPVVDEDGNPGKTHGFVYLPEDTFNGVDRDVFFKDTRFAAVNEDIRKLGLQLNVAQMTTVGVRVDGELKKDIALRNWLTMGFQEPTDEMDKDEAKGCVSLRNMKNLKYLTVGALDNRILRAVSHLNNLTSKYETKGDIRMDVGAHSREIIKAWVRAICKEQCTEEEAMDIYYDEKASFLFGGKAREAYGSDIQAFLGDEKFRTRLFRQEQIWLQKKVDAGVYNFDDLTIFEKALYQNKVILKTDEEIDAEANNK